MRFFDKIKRYRLWDPITKQTSLENGKPRVRRRAVLWSSTSFHNANRENLARGNATSDLFLASSLSSHVTNSIIQNYPNFPLFQRLKGEKEEGYPVKWCASSPPSLSLSANVDFKGSATSVRVVWYAANIFVLVTCSPRKSIARPLEYVYAANVERGNGRFQVTRKRLTKIFKRDGPSSERLPVCFRCITR